MENLFIEGKEFIPQVDFNLETGKWSILGDSYHEYTHEFFDPIFRWVEDALQKEDREITLSFRMNYFNTASSKCFFDIIEMLQEYAEEGKGTTSVNWYYQEDDEDMLETGEDYIYDSGWEINLIPYE